MPKVPETNGNQSNSPMHVGRANMLQTIVVGAIGAFVGITSSLAVTSALQPPVVSAEMTTSNLHAAFRWVYTDKSVDNSGCVNSAVNALGAHAAKGLSKADTGLTVYAHDGSNLIMIACRADHGVGIITSTGPTPMRTLFSDATDLKTRMEKEVGPR